MEVELYVYDLSRGMARVMSKGLTGIQIDAIYHTAIVLGGVEYFYGAGVQTSFPGQTHHGPPMEIVKLGKTELPMDDVLTYLESLKEQYTFENYDLFTHNCNNFSHDFSMFLLGKPIPEHITNLPTQVLNTPFGAMMKNQLDAAMRNVTQAPIPPERNPVVQAEVAAARREKAHPNASSAQPKSPQIKPKKIEVRNRPASESQTQKHPRKLEVRQGASDDNKSAEAANGDDTPPRKHPRKLEVRDDERAIAAHGSVRNLTQLSVLEEILNSANESCAVVFFTSSTCAPCKLAYPTYDSLASEHPKVPFIKVDINHAPEIASKYHIRVTPTFLTFLLGNKENEWSGANPSQLRGNIELLVQQAYPPHPHLKVRAPTLQFGSLRPVTFSKIPPLDKLTVKMGQRSKDPTVSHIKKFLSDRQTDGSSSAPLPDLPAFAAYMRQAPSTFPSDVLFTVYDLMRCALLDPRISGWFIEESTPDDSKTLSLLFSHVLTLMDSDKCPYALRLVTIQLASNLFTSPLFAKAVMSNSGSEGSNLVSTVAKLSCESLLAEPDKPAIRSAASSLAFNLTSTNYQIRREQDHEALPDASQVELAAGLLELLATESSKNASADKGTEVTTNVELLRTALTAFGYLIFCAPRGGELVDLCAALDAKTTIDRLNLKNRVGGGGKDKEAEKVAAEVVQLLGTEWWFVLPSSSPMRKDFVLTHTPIFT